MTPLLTLNLSVRSALYPEGVHWFRALACDTAGNEGAYTASSSTVVDLTDPTAELVGISEASPYAYVDGDRVYYGPGSGSFTVTVQATDPPPASAQASGLATISFPETVSAGGVYTQSGAYSATVAHPA